MAKRKKFTAKAQKAAQPKSLAVIAEECRNKIKADLDKQESLSSTLEMVTEASLFAQNEVERHHEAEPPKSDIDCRAGCSFCCHMRTLASPVEILLLAEHLREKLSQDALTILRKKLAATSRRTRGITDVEHGKAQIPCALLVDDKCSAYEARPLECRGYTSFDVTLCEKAFDDYESWNVPLGLPRYSIFKNVQAGLLMALAGAGKSHEILELNTGLQIALTEPDASERWIAGDDVFQAAALPLDDPARLALQPWTPTFTLTEL